MPATVASQKSKRGLYSVHPSVQYVRNIIDSMKAKTGRSIDEWVSLVKKGGPKDDAARRDWLKKEYGLGTNYASWIAARAAGRGEDDGDADAYLQAAPQYVEQMFEGKRAGLRPIYDALLKLGFSLGNDVKACPCQTMVPLYRNHVFAQIKPASNTRIDLGFCLRGVKTPKRLIDTGGEAKGDRITHRVPITSVDEIDDEVKRWLKKAYELDSAG